MSRTFRDRQVARFAASNTSDVAKPGKSHIKSNEAHGAGKRTLWSYDDHAQQAQRGHQWADHDADASEGSFKHTNGMHAMPSAHIECFSRASNFSGGIYQPSTYTSDKAPGVARASIGGTTKYEVEDTVGKKYSSDKQGGRTFRERQANRSTSRGY